MKRGRVAAKRRLVQIADYALRPTQFEAAYAYDPSGPDRVLFFGAIVGDTEPQSFGDEPIQSDEFTILGGVEAHGYLSPEDAEEAVEDAFDRFETTLLACRRLTHPDIPADRPDLFSHIADARVSSMTGPLLWQPESGHPYAVVDFTVTLLAHLIPE